MNYDLRNNLKGAFHFFTNQALESTQDYYHAVQLIESAGAARAFLALAEFYSRGQFRYALDDPESAEMGVRGLLGELWEREEIQAQFGDSITVAVPVPQSIDSVPQPSISASYIDPPEVAAEEEAYLAGDTNTKTDD